MIKQLTGPQLFLRYAWPCAENRLRLKLISQNDFLRLKFLKKHLDEEIDTAFLAICFPNAVKSLIECKNGLDIWSFESVSDYWRNHHSGTGDCAVRRAIVFKINKKHVVSIGLKHPVVNEYGLELKSGDHVLIHHRIIIEKL